MSIVRSLHRLRWSLPPLVFLAAACSAEVTAPSPSDPAGPAPSQPSAREARFGKPHVTDPYDNSTVLQSTVLFEVHWAGPNHDLNQDLLNRMPTFYGDIAGSDYLKSLGEYGGAGQSTTFGGSFVVDLAFPNPSSISDADIRGMLDGAIAQGEIPNPNMGSSTALYVVHLPPDASTVIDAVGTPFCRSPDRTVKPWCAYHGASTGNNYTFAVIPEQSLCHTCGLGVSYDTINSQSKVVSHEIIEAITDPWLNGTFVTSTPQEIGDACMTNNVYGGQGFTTMPSHNGPAWIVQSPYSNAAGGCVTDAWWSWDTEAYKNSGFVTTRGPFRMDVFSVAGGASATPNQVVTSTYAPTQQGLLNTPKWTRQPGALGGWSGASPGAPVAANARTPFHMDIFTSQRRGNVIREVFPLWSDWWDLNANNGNWNTFYSILEDGHQPGPGAPLSVTSRYQGLLDVTFTDLAGNVIDYFWNGGWGYNVLASPGPGLIAPSTPVSVISRFPDQLDVFATDVNGDIWTWWWNVNSGWQGPINLSVALPRVSASTQVAAVARYPWHIDLFAAADDGSVQSLWYDAYDNGPDRPGTWNALGPVMSSGTTYARAPVAVSIQGQQHIDVFAPTPNGAAIATTWYDEHATGYWLDHQYTVPSSPVGAVTPTGLHAVSRFRGSIDVFGLRGDGSVTNVEWNGAKGQWSVSKTVLMP